MSTPSRSPVGSAWAATTSPTACAQTRWTSASGSAARAGRRAPRCAGPRRRGARGASCRERRLASAATVPSATAQPRRRRPPAPGTCARSVVVITLWPPARDALDEQLAALGVELAHDVVEQQQRRRAALGGERRALGEQQRQQREALLALRAVDAQLAAVAQRAASSSRCGPWPVKPRSRSESSRSASSAASARPSSALRARAVAQRRARRRGRARRRRPRSASRRQVHGARAVVAQRDAVAGELEVPGRRASRGRRGRRGSRASSALRWASACGVRAAGRGARRPERGDELVEVRAAQRRRALDELEAVGQEDANERAHRRVGRRSTGAPSTSGASPRPARSRRQLVVAVAVARRRPRPARPAAPKRTTSRSFDVRHERPVQPK